MLVTIGPEGVKHAKIGNHCQAAEQVPGAEKKRKLCQVTQNTTSKRC